VRTTAAEVLAGQDLTGRRAVITGGCSGLGRETARALASAGAHVTVTGRDPAQVERSVIELRRESGRPHIEGAVLDLASLASVYRFAAWAVRRPVDLLVANAGVMCVPFGHTADGIETHLGINHVGHAALVLELLPALRRARQARVVVVSSSAHRRSDIDLTDPQFMARPYDPWVAYGQSKTANVLFAVGFTERYSGDGITCNAVHPGLVLTGLQRHLDAEQRAATAFYNPDGTPGPAVRSVAEGTATTVWAATSADLAGISGQYLEDCAVSDPYQGSGPFRGYQPFARDPGRADGLWRLTEQLIAHGPRRRPDE
jgi:NAD(P)-dependent dehydrogenase (short-subunit alcohol dehydrogenase family)